MSSFGSIPSMMVGNAIICSKYVFDASAKIVTVSDDIKAFLMIINATDGIVIYNPANPATSGTLLNGKVVSLTFDTTSMSDFDDLLVFCEPIEDRTEHHRTEESLDNILSEMRLLNIRFEEAFKTKLTIQDIDEDIK